MKDYPLPAHPPDLEVSYPTTFSDTNTLLLPVNPESIDTAPVADYAAQKDFVPKEEYHLTVLGSRDLVVELQTKLGELSLEEQTSLSEALNGLIPLLGAARLKPGQYHHVAKTYDYVGVPERREAIIQEAEIDGMDNLYAEFSRITGIELGVPFPHLTLFTKGSSQDSAKGVGIASLEAFMSIEHEPIMLDHS